jgi:hypothetical protein
LHRDELGLSMKIRTGADELGFTFTVPAVALKLQNT